MKKKILITSTELMMLHFLIPHVNFLHDNGYTVEMACAEVGGRFDDLISQLDGICKFHKISSKRTPYTLSNIKGFFQLRDIINNGNYDLIWTNEPVMGVITRVAAIKARMKKTSVIYIAHGFHFFKGAPIIDWLIYYPVEWLCSFITDVLITINREDYNRAKKHMHAKKVEYIPGVGIDTKKFSKISIDRANKRKELEITESDVFILSVGELSKRKNHEVIIKALADIDNPNVHYYIVGTGTLEKYLKKLAKKMGISDRVHLLGYRNDIAELCFIADIFVFPSKQEGLPVALMEAMASGMPVICSNIRGNIDLNVNGTTTFYCSPDDANGFLIAIKKLCNNAELRQRMGEHNKFAVLSYDISNVQTIMEKIYR